MMQFENVDEPLGLMMPPASDVALFATNVEFRAVTVPAFPIQSAPPPPVPVAVLPVKTQLV